MPHVDFEEQNQIWQKELAVSNMALSAIYLFPNSNFLYNTNTEHGNSMRLRIALSGNYLDHFFFGANDVKLTVLHEQDVSPTDKNLQYLKAMARRKNVQVIQNVFHGTTQTAAKRILSEGFRTDKDVIQTNQSMGPALYLAPNADLPSHFFGVPDISKVSEGCILMGDIVVVGDSAAHVSELRGQADWTKARYLSEEIGVIRPNEQFIVRRVYTVRREPSNLTAFHEGRDKFAKPISLKHYMVTIGMQSPKAPKALDQTFAAGQRVVVRLDDDENYCGEVEKVTAKFVYVLFDDQLESKIKLDDWKHIRIVKSKRKRTRALTDAQAKALL